MAVVILALIGVAAVGAAVSMFVQQQRAQRGVIVTGTVIDVGVHEHSTLAYDDHDRRTTTYKPTIEYTDESGTAHRFSPSLSGTTRPQIGDRRQVAYRPDDPSRAVLVAVGDERAAKWVFLVVGIAALAGAIALAAT